MTSVITKDTEEKILELGARYSGIPLEQLRKMRVYDLPLREPMGEEPFSAPTISDMKRRSRFRYPPTSQEELDRARRHLGI